MTVTPRPLPETAGTGPAPAEDHATAGWPTRRQAAGFTAQDKLIRGLSLGAIK